MLQCANNAVYRRKCRHGQNQRQHQHKCDGVDAAKTAANAEQDDQTDIQSDNQQ